MSQEQEQELKIYEVTHRATGVKHFKAATNAEDACKQAGWSIGDCYVVAQKPRVKPIPDHEPMLLVKIPCKTCPFQYAECLKPANEKCPVQPTAPDLQEWLKQVTQAHLCQHYGQDLIMKDYNLGQKWVPMEKAIGELKARH